jgi:hypothetical protein
VPLQIRGMRLTEPAAGDRAWLRDTLDRDCRPYGLRVRGDELLRLDID